MVNIRNLSLAIIYNEENRFFCMKPMIQLKMKSFILSAGPMVGAKRISPDT